MNEELTAAFKALTGFGAQRMEEIGIPGFLFVMIISLIASIFISYLYKYFFGYQSTGSQIHRAFPLLGISVTAIFVTIQFSLPLSLGLLGALSIVRFRTPIKEPEEIGFIMLVIASSICCATFNIVFLALILATAVLALFLLRLRILGRNDSGGMLIVTIPAGSGPDEPQKALTFLEGITNGGYLESLTTANTDTVITYGFSSLSTSDVGLFQGQLAENIGNATCDIFINQQRIA